MYYTYTNMHRIQYHIETLITQNHMVMNGGGISIIMGKSGCKEIRKLGVTINRN